MVAALALAAGWLRYYGSETPVPASVVTDSKTKSADTGGTDSNSKSTDRSRNLDQVTAACMDRNSQCASWKANGECTKNPAFMSAQCCQACAADSAATGNAATASRQVRDPSCSDRAGAGCRAWAESGECTRNPSFMLNECASSCDACDKKARCGWKKDDPTPLGVPAHSHAMLITRAQAISSTRPDSSSVTVLSSDPLVMQFDGFLTSAEAEALTHLASGLGFTPSEVLGRGLAGGGSESDWRRSSHRTSSSVYCDEECISKPVVASTLSRASEVTRLGAPHMELQFVHYDVGQYYRSHHDFLGGSEQLLAGPRALSGLLYLNDVEAGGETSFPALDIQVSPKAGRLLLWADVLDDEPLVKDVRTRHAALPVQRGEKYAANLWYYHRSLAEAKRLGCLG